MKLDAASGSVVVALICIAVQTRADPITRDGSAKYSPPPIPRPERVEPQSLNSPDLDDDDDVIPAIRPSESKGNVAEKDAEEEADDEEEDDDVDGLSGDFSLAWYSGGVAAGVAASDTPSLEGELFVHKPMQWADLSLYVAASSAMGEDGEDSWMEGDVFLTRDLNDEFSIGVGLNNYYFPNHDEPPRMVHAIGLQLDYDGDLFGADLEIEQQYATGADYTYLSASIWRDFSLLPRLTITPTAEMTVILIAGDFFETPGPETFSSGADISYEIKDSISLSFSAIYEVDVIEDPWTQSIEYAVGVKAEF